MARVAILYDGKGLAAWQKRAVEAAAQKHELVYLIFDQERASRRSARHGLYYLLNLLNVRRAQARAPHPHRCSPSVACFHFVPEYDGSWARLGAEALEWLRREKVDAIVKFGLNLLRVEPNAPPILSWHHGDPAHFRGRPAGFYEMLQGKPFVGQIVQRLSNTLDAGEVLVFTESRVIRHSYRKTLSEAYALSSFLLQPALEALQDGRRISKPATGPNYRLPSNPTVVRFAWRNAWALARHLIYGGVFEKHWRCSLASPVWADPGRLVSAIEAVAERWRHVPAPHGFRFIADPFFGDSANDLLVEGYRTRSGKGAILRYQGGEATVLRPEASFHLSYPSSLTEAGIRYVLPEMAQGGKQAVYRVEGERLVRYAGLDIDAGPLLDPTPFRHGARNYLFANLHSEGSSILRLWSSEGLFGRFEEHPASPIRVSARGSRMAGGILAGSGRLVRYGQDCRRSYGDGILAFEIEELTPTSYRERALSEEAFTRASGPHTLNILDGQVVFDWYHDRFAPLAGVRRLLSRL